MRIRQPTDVASTIVAWSSNDEVDAERGDVGLGDAALDGEHRLAFGEERASLGEMLHGGRNEGLSVPAEFTARRWSSSSSSSSGSTVDSGVPGLSATPPTTASREALHDAVWLPCRLDMERHDSGPH